MTKHPFFALFAIAVIGCMSYADRKGWSLFRTLTFNPARSNNFFGSSFHHK